MTFKHLIFSLFLFATSVLFAQNRPNIVLIMTDDQGYADLSAMGNPVLETPHIDS
ncbi:MAG: sulfatase-like hydrolase/transferase, partial [Opitutales bacterium]|nr:sulfatase-like hydrolase/transferase [Opitutales bacterium]